MSNKIVDCPISIQDAHILPFSIVVYTLYRVLTVKSRKKYREMVDYFSNNRINPGAGELFSNLVSCSVERYIAVVELEF